MLTRTSQTETSARPQGNTLLGTFRSEPTWSSSENSARGGTAFKNLSRLVRSGSRQLRSSSRSRYSLIHFLIVAFLFICSFCNAQSGNDPQSIAMQALQHRDFATAVSAANEGLN